MEDVRYNVGDVVNGHVWTGTAWVPVNHVPPHGESAQPLEIGTIVNGHRWDGTQWVVVDRGSAAESRGSKPWYRSPVGIIGIVLAGIVGLALVGAALGPIDDGTTGDQGSASAPQGVTAEEPAQNAEPAPEAAEPVAPEPGVPAGTTRVNDWYVKVADLNSDASAAIEQANQFNEDPDFGYIIVTLEGTNGAKVVKDLQSFTVKFQGADKIVYRDESLFMVMPQELATEAAAGGTVQAQFVFDVPPAALGEGAVVLVDGVAVAIR